MNNPEDMQGHNIYPQVVGTVSFSTYYYNLKNHLTALQFFYAAFVPGVNVIVS